eukprot:749912-Hanusia_phi.AAC.4
MPCLQALRDWSDRVFHTKYLQPAWNFKQVFVPLQFAFVSWAEIVSFGVFVVKTRNLRSRFN